MLPTYKAVPARTTRNANSGEYVLAYPDSYTNVEPGSHLYYIAGARYNHERLAYYTEVTEDSPEAVLINLMTAPSRTAKVIKGDDDDMYTLNLALLNCDTHESALALAKALLQYSKGEISMEEVLSHAPYESLHHVVCWLHDCTPLKASRLVNTATTITVDYSALSANLNSIRDIKRSEV